MAKPNILLIMADQHRYDCIGYAQGYPVRTPNIDRLAAEGVWFTNAYTPIPVCCPARQSFLHGRRPETFGALWNFNNGLKVNALDCSSYTWVKDLQQNGYHTGHIGKWSINPEYTPDYYGFDDYITESQYRAFHEEKYPDIAYHNGFFGERDNTPLEDSRTHWMANQAVQKMDQYEEEDKPWLLCIDFPEPHLPCRPAGRYADMYNPADIPVWGGFHETFANKPYIQKQQLYSWNIESFTWKDWAPIVARYYGIISQVDDAVGMIVNHLDQIGAADNTLVIYTADHGDMCGSHRMMDKHYVLYDDIVRVPLIFRWPHTIPSGLQWDDFICHSLDVPPTLLDITGTPQKDFFQGYSLYPFLKGERVSDWRKEIVATYNGQQFGLYTQRMIRNHTWKYVWNTTDTDELYQLEEDPYELHNVIHEDRYKEIVKDLRIKLYNLLVEDQDGLVMHNAWMKEQLLHGKKL